MGKTEDKTTLIKITKNIYDFYLKYQDASEKEKITIENNILLLKEFEDKLYERLNFTPKEAYDFVEYLRETFQIGNIPYITEYINGKLRTSMHISRIMFKLDNFYVDEMIETKCTYIDEDGDTQTLEPSELNAKDQEKNDAEEMYYQIFDIEYTIKFIEKIEQVIATKKFRQVYSKYVKDLEKAIYDLVYMDERLENFWLKENVFVPSSKLYSLEEPYETYEEQSDFEDDKKEYKLHNIRQLINNLCVEKKRPAKTKLQELLGTIALKTYYDDLSEYELYEFYNDDTIKNEIEDIVFRNYLINELQQKEYKFTEEVSKERRTLAESENSKVKVKEKSNIRANKDK